MATLLELYFLTSVYMIDHELLLKKMQLKFGVVGRVVLSIPKRKT